MYRGMGGFGGGSVMSSGPKRYGAAKCKMGAAPQSRGYGCGPP